MFVGQIKSENANGQNSLGGMYRVERGVRSLCPAETPDYMPSNRFLNSSFGKNLKSVGWPQGDGTNHPILRDLLHPIHRLGPSRGLVVDGRDTDDIHPDARIAGHPSRLSRS